MPRDRGRFPFYVEEAGSRVVETKQDTRARGPDNDSRGAHIIDFCRFMMADAHERGKYVRQLYERGPHEMKKCEGALDGGYRLRDECVDCARRATGEFHDDRFWIKRPTKFPCRKRVSKSSFDTAMEKPHTTYILFGPFKDDGWQDKPKEPLIVSRGSELGLTFESYPGKETIVEIVFEKAPDKPA